MFALSKILLICDTEAVYLKRLSTYLNRYPEFSWHIQTTTNLEHCFERKPEALLIAQSLMDQIGDDRGEAFSGISGSRIIVLQDNEAVNTEYPLICKYQSARKIYEDLRKLLEHDRKVMCEIHLLYAIAGGAEIEVQAEKIAKEKSSNGRVLIVNLEEWPVHLPERDDGPGLGELFYYISQSNEEHWKLEDYVYTEADIDYMYGFRTIMDGMEVSTEHWRIFITEILAKSIYSTVLFVTDHFPIHMDMMTRCDQLWIDWGRDGYAEQRKNKFKKMMTYMGISEVLEKVIDS